MWLFAERGFVSIVQHRTEKDVLLVRGRFRGDIQALFALAVVEETPNADYRFRARLSRSYVATRLRELAEEIDYPNFKNRALPLADERSAAYHAVWDVMARAQERAADPRPLLDRPLARIESKPKRKRKPAKPRQRSLKLKGGLR